MQDPLYLKASVPYVRTAGCPRGANPLPVWINTAPQRSPLGSQRAQFQKERGISCVDVLGVMLPGRVSQPRKERLPKAAGGLLGQEGWLLCGR